MDLPNYVMFTKWWSPSKNFSTVNSTVQQQPWLRNCTWMPMASRSALAHLKRKPTLPVQPSSLLSPTNKPKKPAYRFDQGFYVVHITGQDDVHRLWLPGHQQAIRNIVQKHDFLRIRSSPSTLSISNVSVASAQHRQEMRMHLLSLVRFVSGFARYQPLFSGNKKKSDLTGDQDTSIFHKIS
jgi:hypothetical protein